MNEIAQLKEVARTFVRGARRPRAPITASQRLIDASHGSAADALVFMESTLGGLTDEQADQRRETYGRNEVAREKLPSAAIQFFHALLTPFNGILAFVGSISFLTDVLFAAVEDRSHATLLTIALMIFLSTVIRFWQEFRSGKAAEKLQSMVRTTAAVIRNGDELPHEIHLEDLVPGDVVRLAAGDMIPADLRLLTSKDLFISQAMLTGEALPVEKSDILAHDRAAVKSVGTEALELGNICFMGTNVVSGSATAVVVATGSDTYFGSMAHELTGKRPLTSFDRGINRISWLLIRFMFVMVPIVFVINGVTKHDWLEALLFAVSVAVGLTPEMLPMIVTANLARGAVTMSRRKTIVKRLNSIQSFGAMDILCTDKTGTLTQDKVMLEQHLDIHGDEDIQTLQFAWLNSFHQTGLRNLLDVAVLEYGKKHGVVEPLKSYRKIDEIPFDFKRRRMSVIVREGDRQMLICKGAVEEILALCTQADDTGYRPGGVVEFTQPMRDNVRNITRRLNEDGMRVLAIAYKFLPREDRSYGVADESEMILAGYIAFLDPPKESARAAIAALKKYGVAVKIITGDNEVVTRKICDEVGLHIEQILLGREVETMSDLALAEAAEHTTIFAKMSPMQKSRVIRALQSRGHTVGYLGDGINDAGALRDADVGISVDTAVDIAKEAADIILLEKSLMVLEEGVIEGRRTFANVVKYIKMTASSNFGNVFSVLAASIFLPFLPMLPIHLLIQNLLYDVSQISIPWDRVDEEFLLTPRKWEAGGLARFMICVGPISSLFDIVTFAVLWYVFTGGAVEQQALFQSGWFVQGLLSQTLIVHMIRSEKIPFFQSTAAPAVIGLTLLIMAVGVAIPFSPLGAHIGLVPLPWSYFPWLVAILLGYCTLIQLVKRWYLRRFHQWL